jgi:capsular polysaccharide transport system permease protein
VLIGAEVMKLPVDALKVVAGWLMLAWFGAALALTVGGASAFNELVPRIWQPFSYVLFPLSGAAFMVSALPPAAQEFVLLFPMVHGLELVREGWFGDAVRTRHDMGYMASVSGVLTLTGLLLLRVAARRVEAK